MEIEGLRDEEQEYFDNTPASSFRSATEAAVSAFDEAISSLEDARKAYGEAIASAIKAHDEATSSARVLLPARLGGR